ncbi:MAG: hypothetical protein HGB12_01970 [Bacteroidetes bacterium]|nr:hypothetical protein [Bacteroidota bacterium]
METFFNRKIILSYQCIAIFACLIFTLSACGGKEKQLPKETEFNIEPYKKPFESVNKTLVKLEEEQIQNFIDRYGWNMQKTGTGLQHMIYKKGNGEKSVAGKIAKFNFEVRLITGDICYSSKNEGAKEILLGKSGEISGLEEGLLLLRVGDKAKLIIPSHLAFGLLGDEKKIPKRATLIYDIELLQLK